MSGLWVQIKSFVLTLLLGVIAGLVFHFYQVLIKNIRIGKYSLYICDFIVWILMIGVVFISMLVINQGEMRVYVLIALIIGALIYFRVLAGRMTPHLSGMAKALVYLLKTTGNAIKKPLTKLVEIIKTSIKKTSPPPPDDDNNQ